MPDPTTPCACPDLPLHAPLCPAVADLWHGVAPGGPAGVRTPADSGTCDASVISLGGQPFGPCILRHQHDGPVHKAADGTTWNTIEDAPDPLAPFRNLADQYAAKAAESTRNAAATTLAEARTALPGIAAGWEGAEFLLRHTLADLDNGRTTPDNPPASDDLRTQYAEAIGNAWATSAVIHGSSPRAREDITDAVLAARDQELERLRAQLVTLEHVAAGNKRHAHLNAVDLERAEAELGDFRHNLALRAFTAPDASLDEILASLDARINDAINGRETP